MKQAALLCGAHPVQRTALYAPTKLGREVCREDLKKSVLHGLRPHAIRAVARSGAEEVQHRCCNGPV